MVTSRTGTSSHLRFRREVLRRDRAEGVTHCPACGVLLDYDVSRQPNSAEPDHIVPVAMGGTNDVSNGRVLCRLCNQKRGKGSSRQQIKAEARQSRHVTTLVEW